MDNVLDVNLFFGPLKMRGLVPHNTVSELELACGTEGYYGAGTHCSAGATVQ